MRYTGLAILGGLIALIAVVLILAAIERRVLKPRRAARWEAAKARATWQDNSVSQNGKTMVLVQRVAVDGNRREVLDQILIGTVLDGADNWDALLNELQFEAMKRVYQLNAPNLT